MNEPLLAAASLMALVSFAVHTFVGGKYAARPLLASDLPRATIWLNYFTWHIVTALLLTMALGLAAAAFGRTGQDAVMLIGIIAAVIATLSVVITLKAGIAPWRFPASYLLGVTATLTFAGCFTGAAK